MTRPPGLGDAPIVDTPRLRCDGREEAEVTTFRFAGAILAEDWRAIRALYSPLTGISGGGCLLDLLAVTGFDSTLYSLLVWTRLTRERHGTRFAVLAGPAVRHRLSHAGIGRWLALSSDRAAARAALLEPVEAGRG
ncbi:MAG: hypothetical protein WCO00_16220 [Rhodospirillaceae bacterium]